MTVSTLPKPRKTRVFASAMSLRRKYPTLAKLPLDKYAPSSEPLHFYAKIVKGECNSNTRKPCFTGIDVAEPHPILLKDSERRVQRQALIEPLTLFYTCKHRDIICGQTKVETQNFASHKQGRAINKCETCLSLPRLMLGRRKEEHRIQVRILPGITASFARETQDFASLLG